MVAGQRSAKSGGEASRPGRLGPLTLPSVIQTLSGEKKSGTLVLSDEAITKSLYVDEGRVVFATSTDPDDRLGQLYLRRGMITLPVLAQAAEIATKQRKRMGGVLVEMKAIRPQDLIWGVTEQVRTMVLGLFQWTRGQYRFDPGKPPSTEVITLNMHSADLVLTGIKSIESWSRIAAAVGGLQTPYTTSPRVEALSKELNLTLDEWTLLSRCEGGSTLGSMCADSALGDFEACRLIWAFTVVGLLTQVQEARAKA
jgi:uncharacterized protein DUF4388